MRKNGFTFVELLAVITIIGVLSLIAIPTVEKITKENKEKVYQTQLNNIILSLKNWASDNKEYLPDEENEVLTITLATLKADGYIEYEVKNPKNNKCFDNEMILTITKVKKSYDYSIDLNSIKESNECEVDNDTPVIILNGNSVENIEINSIYVDKGVFAKDKDSNDITSSVVINISGSGNVVDTSTLDNQYIITYSVTANEKTSKVSRTIKIVDTESPELVIPSDITIDTSITSLDIMDGVSATDNSGEAIEVSEDNNITFGKTGKYTITYTASDSSGNTTIKRRIVTIEEASLITSTNTCVQVGNTCSEAEIKSDEGIKVNIQVNDSQSYDFYVIADTGTELTLIMSENLGSTVAWIGAGDYTTANTDQTSCGYTSCNDEGPITALNTLKSLTDNWSNITTKDFVFNDDYSGKKYSNLQMSMKARMLTYTEAYALGCTTSVGSCPDYLYNNDTGFWTSSAQSTSESLAWVVDYDGSLYTYHAKNTTDGGVRPVITITK